jgi:hypothetical protein
VHVHADDRVFGSSLTGIQASRIWLVGHEQYVFPLVLHAGVCRCQVRQGKLDKLVLVLTTDRFATGAIEMGLHRWSPVPQVFSAAALAAFIFFLYARTWSNDPLSTTSAIDMWVPALP